MDPTTPTFNLKAVVQETGVKPDTLRAWERRYGLPEPDRSSGGHRLYSQRDIDTLHWLLARQGEGMSISRAVELWRQLEGENQDPLQSAEYGVADQANGMPLVDGEEVTAFRQKWIEACLGFNERAAEQVLAQGFAIFPTEVVCLEVLQRGIREIGEGWYAGTVSVQQEHFASALVIRKLESLLSATPPPVRPGRILVAGSAEEEHVIGQLLFQLLVRRKGWETVYLGASVPMQRLEESLDVVQPNLVVLTAQQLYTAATLQFMAANLAHRDVPVAYAGRIFSLLPDVRSRISGHYLGDTLQQAVERVEKLMHAPRALPEVAPIPPASQAALAHFQHKASAIQAQVMTLMDRGDIQSSHLEVAGLNLTRAIQAALQLGDLGLLGSEILWIQGLLHNFEIPPAFLGQYISGYSEAAHDVLGELGQPILDWLQQVVAEIATADV
ncbi:MAG: MerR family transcriptional regulator [Caldilineaceae bacterium]|nr:MerR family transcriptional regulator [Caldilineaceae bacterium]